MNGVGIISFKVIASYSRKLSKLRSWKEKNQGTFLKGKIHIKGAAGNSSEGTQRAFICLSASFCGAEEKDELKLGY